MDFVANKQNRIGTRTMLEEAHSRLKLNLDNNALQRQVEKCRCDLLTMETCKIEGKRIQACMRRQLKGDLMIKKFFHAVCEKPLEPS